MNNTLFISTIMVVLFFGSCKKSQNNHKSHECKILKVNSNDIIGKDKPLSELIQIDSIINLEITDASKIGSIDKVIVSNDRIFVMDIRFAKSVFCFTTSGKFINSFKKVGKGVNEYLRIHDFDVFGDKVYVSTYPKYLYELDSGLNIQKVHNINWSKKRFHGDKIIMCNTDTLLFAHPRSSYKFYYYSLKQKKIISKLSPKYGKDDALVAHPFTKMDGKILGNLKLTDSINILTPERILPYRKIEFEYPVSNERKAELRKKSFVNRKFLPSEMRNVKNYYENEQIIYFQFKYQKTLYYFLYNKKSKREIIFDVFSNNDLFTSHVFPLNIRGYFKNSVIVDADPLDLLKSRDSKLSIPENLAENSNPLLLFFRPKFLE